MTPTLTSLDLESFRYLGSIIFKSEDIINVYLGILFILVLICECYQCSFYLADETRLSSPSRRSRRHPSHSWITTMLHHRKRQFEGLFESRKMTVKYATAVEEDERRESPSCSKENEEWTEEQCIICMDAWEEGDSLVRANNLHCRHKFHTGCLAEYFAKIDCKIGHTFSEDDDSAVEAYLSCFPCPCCRRNFLSESVIM